MKIAIAQIDPIVGAFEGNSKKILEAYEKACSLGARILITPELGLCGYPPEDLLMRPEIFERSEIALEELRKATLGKSTALIVGHVRKSPQAFGRPGLNMATVLENGAAVFSQAKTLLPTYDVFDEARYFEPAKEIRVWDCDGKKIGVAICEDLWSESLSDGRRIYDKGPVDFYENQNLDVLLSLSASPYEVGKREKREGVHGDIARRLNCPLVYVNQTGATDEILFDGQSFAVNSDGHLTARLRSFEIDFRLIETDAKSDKSSSPTNESISEPVSEIEGLYLGLRTGIRDYFHRTGFKKAIIGLSGGIDSAVVAVLAADALGGENVKGVLMPSQHTSADSIRDAELLAKNLGVQSEIQPIKFFYSVIQRELSQTFGALADLPTQNLQSRLRGMILMTVANNDNALVLGTSNKSELAMGYSTLYGDLIGALAPLGDLFKTKVYELARHINKRNRPLIPENSINRPPSAELKPDQKDEDVLPPYEWLDPVLEAYLEKRLPVLKIDVTDRALLEQTIRTFRNNEYKRRQCPPVLKVTPRAFGVGRRIPIAKFW